MNYLQQPLAFKLRKVWRYAQVYGPSRTYIKVRAQLHMSRSPEVLHPVRQPTAEQSVGLIGCGNYAFSNIAYYLTRACGHVIGGCMDLDRSRAASLSRHYRVPLYTDSADELLANPAIRLVYIASNHSSHAEYAVAALRHGKDVYIEKPHVVSAHQLKRLVAVMAEPAGKVFLGFNRPGSRFGMLIRSHLENESGPGMYNWFVAGHDIDPGHWYFREEEGGRVLGNLCHWTDFILRLMPMESCYPIRVNPTRAEKSDSDIAVTFTFADGTIAIITFSAMGHTFEGVRERFNAHKGNCLVSMDDFRRLTIDIGPQKKTYFNWYRDHGHARNILSAFESVRKNLPYDRAAQISCVWNTGWLFLKTKEALESCREITIDSLPALETEVLSNRQ
ncbi:MAG: Gfo/Idh/MocA family oxidoreductase [Terriglobia bacterium]